MRASCVLNAEHMIYLLLVMTMVILMISALILGSVSTNNGLVLGIFALIAILGGIIISIALFKRWSAQK